MKTILDMTHEERMVQYAPFARHMAYKYSQTLRHTYSQEDLESVALTCIWQSSMDWKPELGASFGAFMKRRVSWMLQKLCKDANRPMHRVVWHTVSYDQMKMYEDSEPGVEFADETALMGDDVIEHNTKLDQLRSALDLLEPRLRHIVHRRFIEDKTLEQVGQEYGLTRERIRQLEAKALVQLKRTLKFAPQLLKKAG